MKSHYDLASGLEAVATSKRRVKAQAAAKNTGKWVKNLTRARKKLRGCTLNAGALKKLTIDELKGLMLTDLHVGQESIPNGSKDKMVSVFLEKAAAANWNGQPEREVPASRTVMCRRRKAPATTKTVARDTTWWDPVSKTQTMACARLLVMAMMAMALIFYFTSCLMARGFMALSRRCVLWFWHRGRPTRGSAGAIRLMTTAII